MPEKRKTTYKNSDMEYAHREGQRLKENQRKAKWEAELKKIKAAREADRGITKVKVR